MEDIIVFIWTNWKVKWSDLRKLFSRKTCDKLSAFVDNKVLHSYNIGRSDGTWYERYYELHNDYRKKLRDMANNNANWTDEYVEEWKEISFSPKHNVRIRIGADVHEYSPTNGYTTNGERWYSFWKRMSIYKQMQRAAAKGKEMRIRFKEIPSYEEEEMIRRFAKEILEGDE